MTMSSCHPQRSCYLQTIQWFCTISGYPTLQLQQKVAFFLRLQGQDHQALSSKDQSATNWRSGLQWNAADPQLGHRDVQFRCCGGQRSGLTCVPKSGGRWVYRPKVGTIRKSLQGVVGFLIRGWYLCIFLCESSFKKVRMQDSEKIHGSNVMGCLFRKSPNWERNIALRETWFTPEKRVSKRAHQRVMDSSMTQFTYSNQLNELKYCGVVQALSRSSFNQKTSLWNRKLKGVAP